MAALEPFYFLLNGNLQELTKQEKNLLETELFFQIYSELRDHFKEKFKDYFNLIKTSTKKEYFMLETNFLRFIIEDILISREYDLEGIASYTYTPPDVLQEILDGRNSNPSILIFRRIIELHRTIRQDLYSTILKKIANQSYSSNKN